MGLLPLTHRNKKYNQGYYKPINISKYIGGDLPVYRSGIELKFMRWCDDNPSVLKWSSEPLAIKYYDDIKKKQRLYYVDNYVEIKEGNNIKRYLIELKDHKETKQPDPKSKKKKSTLLYEQCQWVTNNCKWRYAKKFAEQNKCEFLLLAHSQKDGFYPVKLDFL